MIMVMILNGQRGLQQMRNANRQRFALCAQSVLTTSLAVVMLLVGYIRINVPAQIVTASTSLVSYNPYSANWTQLISGVNEASIGGDTVVGQIFDVVPVSSSVIYAVGNAALWKTTNGGQDWTDLTQMDGIPYDRFVEVSPVNPSYVFYGQYWSSDGGNTWARISTLLSNPIPSPTNANVLYSANLDGTNVEQLQLENGNWTVASSFGSFPAGIDLISLNPTNPNQFIILTYGGAFYTLTNNNGTWTTTLINGGIYAGMWFCPSGSVTSCGGWAPVTLEQAPSDPSVIYISVVDPFADGSSEAVQHIIYSSNGGQTWADLPIDAATPPTEGMGVGFGRTPWMAVDPLNAYTIFVGGDTDGGVIMNATSSTVTFGIVVSGQINYVAFAPGGTLYIGAQTIYAIPSSAATNPTGTGTNMLDIPVPATVGRGTNIYNIGGNLAGEQIYPGTLTESSGSVIVAGSQGIGNLFYGGNGSVAQTWLNAGGEDGDGGIAVYPGQPDWITGAQCVAGAVYNMDADAPPPYNMPNAPGEGNIDSEGCFAGPSRRFVVSGANLQASVQNDMPTLLYAADGIMYYQQNYGTYVANSPSTNNNTPVSQVNSSLYFEGINSVSRTHPSVVFSAAAPSNPTPAAKPGVNIADPLSGVYESTDGGQTWSTQPIYQPPAYTETVSGSGGSITTNNWPWTIWQSRNLAPNGNPQDILIDGDALSTNGGQSFTPSFLGDISNLDTAASHVYAACYDAKSGGVYIGTSDGVYYTNSFNGPYTAWQPVGQFPLIAVTGLNCPANGMLYASTFGLGIYSTQQATTPDTTSPTVASTNQITPNSTSITINGSGFVPMTSSDVAPWYFNSNPGVVDMFGASAINGQTHCPVSMNTFNLTLPNYSPTGCVNSTFQSTAAWLNGNFIPNLNVTSTQIQANITPSMLQVGSNTLVVSTAGGSTTYTINVTQPCPSGYTGTYPTCEPSGTATFTPLAPMRILDTRCNNSSAPSFCSSENLDTANSSIEFKANTPVSITVPSTVPLSATAVLVNITAISKNSGYVSPNGTSSVLNYANNTVANLATLPVNNGTFNLETSTNNVSIVVDLEGYYAPSSGTNFHPLAPFRLFDTRCSASPEPSFCATENVATSLEPLQPNTGVKIALSGITQIPVSATALAMNLAVANSSSGGYLSVGAPTTSNVNFARGTTASNSVVAGVTNGTISVYNGSSGVENVVGDVFGYYASSSTGSMLSVVTRVCDTRTGAHDGKSAISGECDNGGTLSAGQTITLDLSGLMAQLYPASTVQPSAVTLNVTSVGPVGNGYIDIYPASGSAPVVASANFSANSIHAQQVTVGLSANDEINIKVSTDMNVVIDLECVMF